MSPTAATTYGGAALNRPGLAVQAVADAADGDDLERGDARELLTQPADVDVDGLAVTDEARDPRRFPAGRRGCARGPGRRAGRRGARTPAPSSLSLGAVQAPPGARRDRCVKSPIESRSGIDLGSFASGAARRSTALTRARTSRTEKGLVM